jgi:group II intron reverse transcriptase/maturase
MRNTEGTLKPENVSTKQRRIAELAKRYKDKPITSLNHYLDEEWMRYAYELTRKDGAVGVDGQTATDYANNLEANLKSLLEQIKSGQYKAQPVKRAYVTKADGSRRPLGIPTFESKVAQRAITLLIEPIYEHDFKECSYGFRPGRSAHQALRQLRTEIMGKNGRWILDVDICRFFDTIDKGELRNLIAKRVGDGVIRKMIDKWLKAGILEEGQLIRTSSGTPQGSVCSPILANIYLHYVLDEWFYEEVLPRLRKRASLIRFCDDFVMVFEDYGDCVRVQHALAGRMGRFALSLHSEKTQLVDFSHKSTGTNSNAKATKFNFLGFTHVWGKSKSGKYVVRQYTAKERYTKALKFVNEWCRTNRHSPIKEQHEKLTLKMRGHYAYYGITGNSKRLSWFAYQVRRTWQKWLSRRTRNGKFNWARFQQILRRYPLPQPRIVHHYTKLSEATS